MIFYVWEFASPGKDIEHSKRSWRDILYAEDEVLEIIQLSGDDSWEKEVNPISPILRQWNNNKGGSIIIRELDRVERERRR